MKRITEVEERRARRNQRRGGRRGRRGIRTNVTRTIPTREGRTGIVTSVVEDIVETRNDRVVGVSAINFMRKLILQLQVNYLNQIQQ